MGAMKIHTPVANLRLAMTDGSVSPRSAQANITGLENYEHLYNSKCTVMSL